jgi:hypothetical protein
MKKGKITDRETANRAKVYVYGIKAHKRMEEVLKTNVRIAECMRPICPEPETETTSYTMTFGFRNSFRITVLVLHLYMIWSYFST